MDLLLGQTRPPSGLWMGRATDWNVGPRGMQPAKIWAPFAISPTQTSLISSYCPTSQALQISSVIPERWNLIGPPRKYLSMVGGAEVYLGQFFPTGETKGPEVLLHKHCSVLGAGCTQSHSSYPSNVASFGVCGPGVCFSLTPCSGIFTVGVLSMDSHKLFFL